MRGIGRAYYPSVNKLVRSKERFETNKQPLKREIKQMKMKALLTCALAALALALPQAGATEFKGSTSVGAGQGFDGTGSSTLGGLTYTPGTFDEFGAGSPEQAFIGASSISDSLGQMSLDNTPFTYTGHTFTMTVTFTIPVGSGSQSFSADLTGTVSAPTGGGVKITWTTTSQTYTAANGMVFTLEPDNQSITHGRTVFLSGTITVVSPAVPDGGSTVALLGIALTGIEAGRRLIRARKA